MVFNTSHAAIKTTYPDVIVEPDYLIPTQSYGKFSVRRSQLFLDYTST